MSRTIRVTVRGSFGALSEPQRAALLAERAEHDFLRTVYTPEGYLAYDLPRPFFTFRFAAEVDAEDQIAAVTARSQAAAAAWMAERGYPVKDLSVQAVDMSQVPLGKRGRRQLRVDDRGSST